MLITAMSIHFPIFHHLFQGCSSLPNFKPESKGCVNLQEIEKQTNSSYISAAYKLMRNLYVFLITVSTTTLNTCTKNLYWRYRHMWPWQKAPASFHLNNLPFWMARFTLRSTLVTRPIKHACRGRRFICASCTNSMSQDWTANNMEKKSKHHLPNTKWDGLAMSFSVRYGSVSTQSAPIIRPVTNLAFP